MENNSEEKQQTEVNYEKESCSSSQSSTYGALMRHMLVGLSVFFFLASLVQLFYLHARIADPPGIDLDERLVAAIPAQLGGKPTDLLSVYAALESQALSRRYHQGNVLLMSRIWVSYLSFVTGMILCLVGASFILGRLREPMSTIDTDSKLLKFSVNSSSPGIILASLGTVLIITSIMTNHRIEIQDSSVYLGRYADARINKSGSYMPQNVESEDSSAKENNDNFDCIVDPDGPQCQEQKK